jgi:hypothetical protein
MSMANQVDVVLAATGSKATYGGSASMIGGWFFSSEFAILVGMLVGVAGLVVNWYYRDKLTRAEILALQAKNERQRELHEITMAERREAMFSRKKP